MRNKLALVGMLGLAVAAKPAAAITPGTPSTLCVVAGGLNACAKATVTLTGTGFNVLLENLAGATYTNYDFVGVAFYYYGNSSPGTIAYTSQTPSWVDLPGGGEGTSNNVGNWNGTVPNDLVNPGPDITPFAWWGASTASSADDRLEPGYQVTLSFTSSFYKSANAGNLQQLYWAWRGVEVEGGPEGVNSLKCYETGEAEPAADPAALCGSPTVVPEPATMALLATGLVGLGGAGLIRRRRQA